MHFRVSESLENDRNLQNSDRFLIHYLECDEVLFRNILLSFPLSKSTINNWTFWHRLEIIWPLIRFFDFIRWKRTFQQNTLRWSFFVRQAPFEKKIVDLICIPKSSHLEHEETKHFQLFNTFLLGRAHTSILLLYLFNSTLVHFEHCWLITLWLLVAELFINYQIATTVTVTAITTVTNL